MNDARQSPGPRDPAAQDQPAPEPAPETRPDDTVGEPTGLNPEAQPGIPDEVSPAEGGD